MWHQKKRRNIVERHLIVMYIYCLPGSGCRMLNESGLFFSLILVSNFIPISPLLVFCRNDRRACIDDVLRPSSLSKLPHFSWQSFYLFYFTKTIRNSTPWLTSLIPSGSSVSAVTFEFAEIGFVFVLWSLSLTFIYKQEYVLQTF